MNSKDKAQLLVALAKTYIGVMYPFAVQLCEQHGYWAMQELEGDVRQHGIEMVPDQQRGKVTVNIVVTCGTK
jgi:hypothetical protein